MLTRALGCLALAACSYPPLPDEIDATIVDATVTDGAGAIDAQDAQSIDAVVIPPDMVDVPAGAFSMGCNLPAGCGSAPDALPFHVVTLRRFAIERTEVSRAAYAECLTAGVCVITPLGGVDASSNLPVQTTWQGAVTYCAWRGRRLPTEAEWEKASRSYDERIYPWGNLAPTCELARFGACTPNMMDPVDSHPTGVSPYGALNMSGNQWEWAADWHSANYYQSSPASDPPGPATGTERVVRGGDYLDSGTGGSHHLMSWYRRKFDPTSNAVGFRCALSL